MEFFTIFLAFATLMMSIVDHLKALLTSLDLNLDSVLFTFVMIAIISTRKKSIKIAFLPQEKWVFY
jgi:hypothetical protein